MKGLLIIGKEQTKKKKKVMGHFHLHVIFLSQFMKFMNHKKSRVTDLFRKMDTDNDGAVPRDDFIDGLLKTSRFNFHHVMDIFPNLTVISLLYLNHRISRGVKQLYECLKKEFPRHLINVTSTCMFTLPSSQYRVPNQSLGDGYSGRHI